MSKLNVKKINTLLPFLKYIRKGECLYDLNDLDRKTIQYAIDSGLGQILHHYSKKHPQRENSYFHYDLLSTDFTSRILIGNHLDALLEIYQTDPDFTKSILLLKGISTCLRYYPEPHLRTMGDVDLLVSKVYQTHLEKICHSLGYLQTSHLPLEFYINLHHSMPFYHPKKNVWIEVHTMLFPLTSSVAYEEVFKIDEVLNQTCSINYNNYSFKILVKEYELIYICAHWAIEHNWMKGLIRIVDIIYILNTNNGDTDWNKILTWLKRSPVTASYLYLILTYLYKNDLVELPNEFIKKLSFIQNKFNSLNLIILHTLIEKYLVEGRKFGNVLTINNVTTIWITLTQGPSSPISNILRLPWNIFFPPDNPKRFNIMFLLSRFKKIFK